MTKAQIITRIERLCSSRQETLGAEVYFLLKKDTSFELVFADVNDETENEILNLFLLSVKDIIEDDEKVLMMLSEADNRSNLILEYNLEEFPRALDLIKQEIPESVRLYNFSTDSFNNIFGYIIKIGTEDNYLTIFRKHYPVSVINKDKTFSIKRLGNESRFTKVDEDILKITFGVDFLIIDSSVFILNLSVLERFFDFHVIIKKEAAVSIGLISRTGLLVECEGLKKEIENASFARKIVRVTSRSKVIGVIPVETIIKFTKENHFLAGKFSYNESGTKISLSTKKSRLLFLKVLNDDILISELTKTYYDSSAKDAIE